MRLLLLIILLILSFGIYGQQKSIKPSDTISITKDQISQTINLLKDLNSKGADLIKDSLFVSEEFKKLLNDETYRKTIYPDVYSWEQTINYIQTKDLKKAFWFLINLYPTSDKNKELVVRSVITYDALFNMDKVLINTFYTYAFTDPEVSIIVENSPEIKKPDILENKLRTVNELIQYINKHRETETTPKQMPNNE